MTWKINSRNIESDEFQMEVDSRIYLAESPYSTLSRLELYFTFQFLFSPRQKMVRVDIP